MNLAYVFSHGDPVLISTFMLLILMSATSWYIIFWKSWQLHKEKKRLKHFRKLYVTSPDWPKHASLHNAQGGMALLIKECDETRAVLNGYDKTEKTTILGMHLAQTLDIIRTWSDRGLTLLASIGSSAPFIGLFGTVWGIYGALTKIATEGNASLNVVAGPMGEALVATAAGLFAAIPAVLAYNAFIRSNRLIIQDYRHLAEHLTTYLAPIPHDTSTTKSSKPVQLVSGGM